MKRKFMVLYRKQRLGYVEADTAEQALADVRRINYELDAKHFQVREFAE